MSAFDYVFLGVPAASAIVLVVTGLNLMMRTNNTWYMACVVCGILSLFMIVGVMVQGPGAFTGWGWVGSLAWFALGFIVYEVLKRSEQVHRA
jgi:hypothetical protein